MWQLADGEQEQSLDSALQRRLDSARRAFFQLITVSNYTGKDREYIKKLLFILGVPYTPTMTNQNTAVIAAK